MCESIAVHNVFRSGIDFLSFPMPAFETDCHSMVTGFLDGKSARTDSVTVVEIHLQKYFRNMIEEWNPQTPDQVLWLIQKSTQIFEFLDVVGTGPNLEHK